MAIWKLHQIYRLFSSLHAAVGDGKERLVEKFDVWMFECDVGLADEG